MASNNLSFNEFGRNILITGGNSGIGFYSVINLLKSGNYLYIPIKSISRKNNFIKQLKEIFEVDYLNNFLHIIDNCDFSDLKNINKIKEYLFNKKIDLDIVILNAGIQYTGSFYPKVSKQNVELTFAINHLAHFYLLNILLPFIKESSQSRIIITSSDVHDPNSSGGNVGEKAGLNGLLNFKNEIMGSFENFNADKSYKNSKLCNILFAKELARRLISQNKSITVISWAPGLVIPKNDLGFFRYSSRFNKYGYIAFSSLAKNILGISESVENAGYILYQITMKRKFNNLNYLHLSNRLIFYKKHKLIESNVSKEADDPKLALKLWKLSIELCSLFGLTIFDL